MTKDQLWQKISDHGGSWFSGRGKPSGKSKPGSFNLYGLRQTKHPRDAIKLMTDDERKAALAALKDLYPTPPGQNPEIKWEKVPGSRRGIPLNWFEERIPPKDRELMSLLSTPQKSVNEEMIRHYVRETLLESKSGEPDMTKYVDDLEDEIFTILFQKSTFDHLQSQAANSESTVILNTSLFDEYDNIDEVHLGMSVNDSNSADVQAAYICVPKERNLSNLALSISIPRDYPQVEGFQDWLSAELADTLSHEIQHSCDTSEMLGGDIPEGEAKWESLENIEKYFASNAETRGHIAGILGRSRRTGLDPEGLLDRDMSTIMSRAIDHGYTESELTPVLQRIYDKWFARLGDLS
jgi:hypothetical protein